MRMSAAHQRLPPTRAIEPAPYSHRRLTITANGVRARDVLFVVVLDDHLEVGPKVWRGAPDSEPCAFGLGTDHVSQAGHVTLALQERALHVAGFADVGGGFASRDSSQRDETLGHWSPARIFPEQVVSLAAIVRVPQGAYRSIARESTSRHCEIHDSASCTCYSGLARRGPRRRRK